MNPKSIRTLRRGQMMRADEWNTVVDAVQNLGDPQENAYVSKFGTATRADLRPHREKTLFYTESEIPPFAIFAVSANAGKNNGTQRAEFIASQYSEENKSSYLAGYIGCNGPIKVPAGCRFYGYLISEDFDVVVSAEISYNRPECGLTDARWEATEDGSGLIITGTYDESRGLYTVRKVGGEHSELFGTLDEAWNLEEEERKITLLEGYSHDGEDSMLAWPAPTLETQLEAGKVVNIRYVEQAAKWFFFARTEGGAAAVRVTASGTALGGFGIHDGKRVWACTLAAGSLPVDVYSTPAVEEQKTAYFFDGKECWTPLPVSMTDFYGNLISDVAEVAGDLFRSVEDGKIYKKEDFGTVYIRNGVIFRPTFQRLNFQDVWKGDDQTWLYYERRHWIISGDFGSIIEDPETETRPFSTAILDLVQEYVKPCWQSEDGEKFGIYTPQNGASGTVQLGSEWWTGPQNAVFFQIPELDDYENYQYSGELTIGEKVFSEIHRDGEVWVLGSKDAPDGWYESESFSKDSSPAVFRFRHESETAEDIQLEFQGYAAGNFTRPVLMIQPGIMT